MADIRYSELLKKSGHNCSSLTDWQTKSKGQAAERIIKTTIETLNRTCWSTMESHIFLTLSLESQINNHINEPDKNKKFRVELEFSLCCKKTVLNQTKGGLWDFL